MEIDPSLLHVPRVEHQFQQFSHEELHRVGFHGHRPGEVSQTTVTREPPKSCATAEKNGEGPEKRARRIMMKNPLPTQQPTPPPPPSPVDIHEQSRRHMLGEVEKAETDLRKCETRKMKDHKADLKKTKKKLSEAEQKITALEIELQKTKKTLHETEQKKATLEMELERERSECGQCQKEQCASIKSELSKKRKEIERLEKEKRKVEEKLQTEMLKEREMEQKWKEYEERITVTLKENDEGRERAKQLMKIKDDELAWYKNELRNQLDMKEIKREVKEIHRELISQKMEKTAELEKKLEAEKQQSLTYAAQLISHGVEMGRLHELLQTEKEQSKKYAAELYQYHVREQKNNSKNKQAEKRENKAERKKNEGLERQVRSLQDENAQLFEKVQQLQHTLESPECHKPYCVQLEQKIKEQQKAIQMVSPMKDMARQYGGQHDQLKSDYEELMTNPDGILGQLEKEFDDPFDAKVVLGGIFMAAYEECKKYMIEIFVSENLKQLFTVQMEPDEERQGSNEIDMDDLSRAFGLLLDCTAAKSQVTYSIVIPTICEEVKQKIPDLESYRTAQKKVSELPVEQIVKLAWKFVAVPNPMIVCQPETFSPDIHSRDFQHWEKLEKPFRLKYARPVVYRSYHGLIACKGLVGNEVESSVDP